MKNKTKETLKKQHYALVGEHSGIQVCRWNKKSLLDEGACYKAKFYGIKSHECCQMTPCFLCQNQCLHCWRAVELTIGEKLGKTDEPKKIIEECVIKQRKMISGFGGNKKLNRNKFREAQTPKQFAISLSGEPTLYPKIAELIKELRNQGKTSFLVTNGLLPKKLRELAKKKVLPTQLYVSLNYPDEKTFKEITRNRSRNAWKQFNETLSILSRLKTRRVLRMTLVRRLNMQDDQIKNYAKLIKKARPDFVEAKAYMSVGFARERLGYDRMPMHPEIRLFAKKLEKALGKPYKILDEHIPSRVVLIGKNKKKMKITPEQV